MSSSAGNCHKCKECNHDTKHVCHMDGDFYSTGEYARIINEYDIHGTSFNQKVDSVKELLDYDTIQILKVLLQENDAPTSFNTITCLEIVGALEMIQSRLSNDNKIRSISGGVE